MTQKIQQFTEEETCEHFLLRNIRYHEDREMFFGRLTRLMSFFTLTSGLATVAALAGKLPDWAKVDPAVIGATTSVVGALQLVFGFSRSENQHADLRKQFLRLVAELGDGDYKAIMKKARGILAGEPPSYRAVNALAYNVAQGRFDRPHEYDLRVRWWQRAFRNISRFTGAKFSRFEDVQAAREQRRAARRGRWPWIFGPGIAPEAPARHAVHGAVGAESRAQADLECAAKAGAIPVTELPPEPEVVPRANAEASHEEVSQRETKEGNNG